MLVQGLTCVACACVCRGWPCATSAPPPQSLVGPDICASCLLLVVIVVVDVVSPRDWNKDRVLAWGLFLHHLFCIFVVKLADLQLVIHSLAEVLLLVGRDSEAWWGCLAACHYVLIMSTKRLETILSVNVEVKRQNRGLMCYCKQQ